MAVVKPADLSQSAVKFNSELMTLPFVAFSELGKANGFFVKKGVYGDEKTTQLHLTGRMRPYHSGGPSDLTVEFITETLTTYLGEDYSLFEIASLLDTVWGKTITSTEKLTSSVIGKKMIAEKVIRNLEAVRKEIWRATRKSDGTTTLDLFDGFDQIIAKAITSGKLSTAKKNLSTLSAVITPDNAIDVLKRAYKALPEELKDQETIMYVTTDIYEDYCEAYEALRGAQNDDKLEQRTLHGSEGRCIIKRQAYRDSNSPVIFSVKNNLTIGLGGGGEKEKLTVKPDNNLKFMQILHMLFFGTAISCFDHRVFHVAKQHA